MSLNDFVILQKLGSGSFASVYKARRLIDQQIYALKKIDMKALGSKEKNNALNQIRLLACLSSPYIIGYCESFFDEKLDILTIAMEYANQGDLFKKIEKQKKLKSLMSEVEVWRIFIHLLYGLNELHSKNILHRDLKAQNIFIANGVYKIGDMNVSKIIKNGLASTQTGTPYYASPQVWNDQPYNDKSDIWSLGCILYEIAALRPPYQATSMEKLFDMVTKAPSPKIPANYSREIQLIVDSCLQKNPGNRPSTKELLSNHTLKIYENLLIDFKPQMVSDMKQPFLKTIYMPSSKRQLKNQLPQSNYKSSQSKNIQKHQNQQSALTPRHSNKEQQVKPILTKVDNLIKNNESEKKLQSQSNHKSRNRIKSCQIFKDNSCKKIPSSLSSKQNLMARADYIIESQKKVSKSKQKDNNCSNNPHSVVKAERMFQKKTSNKEIIINFKPPIQSSKQHNSVKCLNKEIYIEDQDIVVPKKLIFDDSIEEKPELSGLYVNQAHQKILGLESAIKSQQTSQIKIKVSNNCNEKKSTIQQSPKLQSKLLEVKDQDLCKEVYFQESLNNISVISSTNHQHYKFQTNFKSALEKNQKFQNPEQQPKPQLEEQISNVYEHQSFPISVETTIIETKPVNILIDVNQNPLINNEPKGISPRSTMSYLLGLQKTKHLAHNICFKNLLFSFGCLKNQFLRQINIAKESELQLKIYHQSYKTIKETLNPSSIKLNTQNTPSKTFQKRSRSKSIRKTQQFKVIPLQTKPNSNSSLVDKINQKMKTQSNAKKSSKEKSAKKDKTSKKIFEKENQPVITQQNANNVHNFKQLALIPKAFQPSAGGKVLSRQKSRPDFSHQVLTQHKSQQEVLRSLHTNSLVNQQHKTQKKLTSFNGINLFEQKKKKIFEAPLSSPNPVHTVNNHLDKIHLENKLKKYINF